MRASWYAEALFGALNEKKRTEADTKKVIARFKKVVSARGHERLFPAIAREFEKVFAREERKREVVVVVADAKKKNKWSHAYDHYEKEGLFPKGATPRTVVDDTIVGGFQIKTRDILIDGSYKRSLIELYRNIITSR